MRLHHRQEHGKQPLNAAAMAPKIFRHDFHLCLGFLIQARPGELDPGGQGAGASQHFATAQTRMRAGDWFNVGEPTPISSPKYPPLLVLNVQAPWRGSLRKIRARAVDRVVRITARIAEPNSLVLWTRSHDTHYLPCTIFSLQSQLLP